MRQAEEKQEQLSLAENESFKPRRVGEEDGGGGFEASPPAKSDKEGRRKDDIEIPGEGRAHDAGADRDAGHVQLGGFDATDEIHERGCAENCHRDSDGPDAHPGEDACERYVRGVYPVGTDGAAAQPFRIDGWAVHEYRVDAERERCDG